jgi:hypothetical protein
MSSFNKSNLPPPPATTSVPFGSNDYDKLSTQKNKQPSLPFAKYSSQNQVPVPPKQPPPPVPANYLFNNNQNNTNTTMTTEDETETDSVVSCQLISSASLLLNRDVVRHAQQGKPAEFANKFSNQNIPQTQIRKHHFTAPSSRISGLSQVIEQQSPSQLSDDFQQQQQQQNSQNIETTDASKPPPMETAI